MILKDALELLKKLYPNIADEMDIEFVWFNRGGYYPVLKLTYDALRWYRKHKKSIGEYYSFDDLLRMPESELSREASIESNCIVLKNEFDNNEWIAFFESYNIPHDKLKIIKKTL